MVTSVAIKQTSATDSSYAGTTLVGASYGYDDAGRVSSVTSTSTANGSTTTFGYDDGTGAMSTVSTAATSGDIVTTYHYNASNGHLESIVTTQGSTIIYEEDNTYPDAGSAHYDQITRQQVTALVTNSTSSPTTQQYYITYTYDSQNQLTSMVTTSGVYGSTESHSTLASETFSYDAVGNRTDLTYAAWISSANAYLAVKAGPPFGSAIWELYYDARGNLTMIDDSGVYVPSTNGWAYTYDSLSRMTSATPGDHSKDKAVYSYDSQNRRTSETLYAWDPSALGGAGDWSTTPASVTDYLYNGQTLWAEVNGLTGKMIKSYQWDPTKPNGVGGLLCITTYDSSGAVTGKYKPVYDSNANVVALIDLSTSNVVANYSYSAFGICTATGPDADVCMFRFGGMYWQASSNLYYDHARDYDPFWGRFVERDPSGEDNSLNLYAYCHNDPVNRVDPTGLADQPITSDHRARAEMVLNELKDMLKDFQNLADSDPDPVQRAYAMHNIDDLNYLIGAIQRYLIDGRMPTSVVLLGGNDADRQMVDTWLRTAGLDSDGERNGDAASFLEHLSSRTSIKRDDACDRPSITNYQLPNYQPRKQKRGRSAQAGIPPTPSLTGPPKRKQIRGPMRPA